MLSADMESGDFTTVGIIILIISLVVIAIDIYLYAKKKPTFSQVLTKFSYYSPVLPFIAGFLCGHWWW